jgi:hypothetical protein
VGLFEFKLNSDRIIKAVHCHQYETYEEGWVVGKQTRVTQLESVERTSRTAKQLTHAPVLVLPFENTDGSFLLPSIICITLFFSAPLNDQHGSKLCVVHFQEEFSPYLSERNHQHLSEINWESQAVDFLY